MLSFSVTVLEADRRLCKTFRNGIKENYPHALIFTSSIHHVSSLQTFCDTIKLAASKGACLLKGGLDQALKHEQRKGHHLTENNTSWLCFDIDHLPSLSTIDDFLKKIGVTDVSYIHQWSGSYGVCGNYELKCHLFFMLDEPASPADLKLWLKQLNLQLFASELALSSDTNTLKWGLDISVCQNDKLIFVAPPRCIPSSDDTFTQDRIFVVKRDKDMLTLPANRLGKAQIATLETAKFNELRKAQGLDPKKRKMKAYKDVEYQADPDEATIKVAGIDGDFVRINLNDGDSAAYFHPVGNCEILYNFKGEPNYKIQELDPDYYYRTIAAMKQAKTKQHKGKLFLGFRDFRTGRYYNGTYDQATDKLDLAVASTGGDVRQFLEDHGQPVPKAIPTWRVTFNPMAPPIDLTKRQVNLFAASEYMKEAEIRTFHNPFPRIDALMRHVVGASCIQHWYNWLAFLYQRRVAPGTAWIWHGTQGTGKGLIFNLLLKPLFGESNTVERRMEQLNEGYNSHLENCLLCFIDEAQIGEAPHTRTIMSSLKNQITEPVINISRKYVSAYDVTNYVGWIFASNMHDPVVITSNDRRFNVAEYQGTPWPQPTADDIKALQAELLDFAVFLRLYQVDEMAVREVLKNEEREQMILVSQPSADTVANHIKQGALSELWDYLPTDAFSSLDTKVQDAYMHYKALLYDLVKTERNRLSRDDVQKIFSYCVGNVPIQSAKFTSYLRHHGIAINSTRSGANVFRGMSVRWKDPPEWFAARREEIQEQEQPQLKVVK